MNWQTGTLLGIVQEKSIGLPSSIRTLPAFELLKHSVFSLHGAPAAIELRVYQLDASSSGDVSANS